MRTETSILILAAILLSAIAFLRPPEYDEAYSLFLTAGHARPAWPTTPFHPAAIRSLYFGRTTFPEIANELRYGDVHPPLYFWLLKLWRCLFGPAWLTARLLSVAFAIATLATLAQFARTLKAPPARTLLICLLTYGFAYTSIVARGFALAQLLLLTGTFLIFKTLETVGRKSKAPSAIHVPRRSGHPAPTLLLAGALLGAATFTNYLTVFTALTALGYLTLKSPRQAPIAILPFAAFLPLDAWFFAIQHATRAHQFAPFSLSLAFALLAKDSAAAWFGGLPLYAGRLAIPVAAALALLAALTIAIIARHRPPHSAALAALTCATPAGLLALGVIFHNTPIEIRYLAFSLPYFALLIATGTPRPLQALLWKLQFAAIAGLAFSPLTAQSQRATARAAAALSTPDTVTLLPFGNDGVGIPGPFLASAPDTLTILLIHPNAPPDLTAQTRLILATLTPDAESRVAVTQTLAELAASACWRAETTTPLVRTYLNTCQSHGQSMKLSQAEKSSL
jgi:hypothetical protein